MYRSIDSGNPNWARVDAFIVNLLIVIVEGLLLLDAIARNAILLWHHMIPVEFQVLFFQ